MSMSDWNFLTNYGHVVVYLSGNPDARIRDLAEAIGITERAAQRIVSDLVDDGYLIRTRTGRRNSYEINPTAPLRHPLERDHEVGELVKALGTSKIEP
jgi:DNA-binding Lrp family transcriptional regulator